MSWDVTVAGTVHVDDVTTPHGRRSDQFGGSAVYFSLAASRHARVHFNAIVGIDRVDQVRSTFSGLAVDLSSLVVSETPTFRWQAVHDFQRWVADTISDEEGCDPEWVPRLPALARRAEVLFLGSMRPELQQEVLRQSSARLIGLDSMACFTGPERARVLELAEASDVLFLNRDELEVLVPEAPGWREAASRLCARGRLRAVVIKRGPEGAALVVGEHLVERAAGTVVRVIDPTGAGDAFAGGFLGRCAAAQRDDEDFFVEALDEGLSSAAAAIGTFGVESLLSLARAAREVPAGTVEASDPRHHRGTAGPSDPGSARLESPGA